MTPLDRVGIVMLSTAGGAVWTLPLLTAIKRAHPAARISWIMQPGAAALVQGHAAVDEIIAFDRGLGVRGYLDLRRRTAGRRFDTLLVLQTYLKAGIVASLVPAAVKLGFDRGRARDLSWLFTNRKLPARAPRHVQDQYLEFLDAIGVPAEPVVYDLGPWSDERPWQREFFASFERPAVAMVVATTKPEKDWMPERWAEVSDALWHDFGLEPVIVGGRSEREVHAERVIGSLARHTPRSALGSGLRRLLCILDGSVLTISPDTGPLHMAVAIERPVVSLFGYTNPGRTGPYGRYHDLLVDAYGDAGEAYPASAGPRPGRMARIQVRDVLDRVERWKRSYATSSAPKV
ncbi:MAG: glycosyltransferase family 9 protein [Gemmatimonadaceae bacterium]